MPDIETYYLIDFENVNDAGIECQNQLGSHDHIHIFSTKNASKISIECLENFNNTDFNSHFITAGKQSLDMSLVAYLGYLIGKNSPSEKYKYIIVSKDNDYDNVISFFKGFTSSIITRQPKITEMPQKTAAQTKTQLNNEIQKILSKASCNKEIISYVTSFVCQHYKDNKAKQIIYRAIVAQYGQKQGLDIYNHIKKIL